MSGVAIGSRNGMTRDPDDVVRKARELRKQRMALREIANLLSTPQRQISHRTVQTWCKYSTRAFA